MKFDMAESLEEACRRERHHRVRLGRYLTTNFSACYQLETRSLCWPRQEPGSRQHRYARQDSGKPIETYSFTL